MVVYAQPVQTISGCVAPASIRGFTFGEYLGANQSSITIEKTDLDAKGLAQFIFSEFCRLHWADRPLVNVGDDWGLPTLAWTKQSYRPLKLLEKYSLRLAPVTAVATSSAAPEQNGDAASFKLAASPSPSILLVRRAEKADLAAVDEMEQATFTSFALNRRQLQYHQNRESSIFLVAEEDGRLVGDGIALLRQHKNGVSGRIYSLAVRSDSRGRRIGSRLLEALLKSLSSRGVSRCYLEVEQSNESAIRLYARCGFRHIGDLPDYYGPARPGVHMMCALAGKNAVVVS
jgi:ribosomal protein S18 acetylase RimI-like enzyme